MLSFSHFLQQAKLFFQRQLKPGFPHDDPDAIDPGLKLDLAPGANMMQIGDGFGERHLEFTRNSAHYPYSRKDYFLVNSAETQPAAPVDGEHPIASLDM